MPLLTTRLIYTTVKQNVKPVSILKAVAKPGICLVCLVYPRDRHGEKQLTLAKLLTLTKIYKNPQKWSQMGVSELRSRQKCAYSARRPSSCLDTRFASGYSLRSSIPHKYINRILAYPTNMSWLRYCKKVQKSQNGIMSLSLSISAQFISRSTH